MFVSMYDMQRGRGGRRGGLSYDFDRVAVQVCLGGLAKFQARTKGMAYVAENWRVFSAADGGCTAKIERGRRTVGGARATRVALLYYRVL